MGRQRRPKAAAGSRARLTTGADSEIQAVDVAGMRAALLEASPEAGLPESSDRVLNLYRQFMASEAGGGSEDGSDAESDNDDEVSPTGRRPGLKMPMIMPVSLSTIPTPQRRATPLLSRRPARNSPRSEPLS